MLADIVALANSSLLDLAYLLPALWTYPAFFVRVLEATAFPFPV